MKDKVLTIVISEFAVKHGIVLMGAQTRNALGITTEMLRNPGYKIEAAESADRSATVTVGRANLQDLRRLKREQPDIDISSVLFVNKNLYKYLTNDNTIPPKVKISIHVTTDFLIGADPEFLILNKNGNPILTYEFLDRLNSFGSDGILGELRPNPEYSVEGFVTNIYNILEENSNTSVLSKYKWEANCFYQNKQIQLSVGGHIHIDNPPELHRSKYEDRWVVALVLNKILDEKLGIMLVKFDREDGRKRRLNMGYGAFGKFRFTHGRLEYRTPSGLWLVNPSIASSVLGTAKAIADEVFSTHRKLDGSINNFLPKKTNKKIDAETLTSSKVKNIELDLYNGNLSDKWSTIPICEALNSTASSQDIKNILEQSDPSWINTSVVNSWFKHMATLSIFEKYKKYIETLADFLSMPDQEIAKLNKNIKHTWLENGDIFEN